MHRMNMRMRLLEKVELMLNAVLCEIRFLATPATEIISDLCNKNDFDDLQFLKLCNKKLNSGYDFRSAWSEALCTSSDKIYFKKSDLQILSQFGNQLGTTDAQGQSSICALHLESVKINIRDSREQKEKYGNLIYGLSFLFGIGIIIVFI